MEDYSFNYWLTRGGPFTHYLAETLQRADMFNKRRLTDAFPQMGAAHSMSSWDKAPPGFPVHVTPSTPTIDAMWQEARDKTIAVYVRALEYARTGRWQQVNDLINVGADKCHFCVASNRVREGTGKHACEVCPAESLCSTENQTIASQCLLGEVDDHTAIQTLEQTLVDLGKLTWHTTLTTNDTPTEVGAGEEQN